jgi:endonuclease-3
MKWTKPRIEKLMALLQAAHPDAGCGLRHSDPFQLIVATILSAQCTDERVNLTTPWLFERYPDAAALAGADTSELEAIIRPTGFFRNKAKNLVAMASMLLKKHGGGVPNDREALGGLPGVGRKTANVVLANAFGIPALAVDTHVFRLARRLGLSGADTPERVEADLCDLFPKESWIALHHQLIWHGRRVCSARAPKCAECTISRLCAVGTGTLDDPHLKGNKGQS